jgi:hypothetical protein
VEDPLFGSRIAGELPQHPLFGPAYRLAWYTRKLGRDRVELDDRVRAWLAMVAVRDSHLDQLRGRYRTFGQARRGA